MPAERHAGTPALIIALLLSACATAPVEETLPTPAGAPAGATVAAGDAVSANPTSAPHETEIDELFDFIGEDEPGAAVMVVHDGTVVFAQGYGLADVARGTPITPSSLFHLASAGKQFTGMAIMKLHEEGQLDYDDPVATHLPELGVLGEAITIRQLLHHTSGLPGHEVDDGNVYGQLAELPAPTNADEMALLAGWSPSDLPHAPGDYYDYSNLGYDALGSLIESVSGSSFADYMHDEIFAPAGMTSTFSLPNGTAFAQPLRARGYDPNGDTFTPNDSDPLDAIVGSGSIYSSVADLYRYDQALYTDVLVSQATLQDAFTPATLNDGSEVSYGYGWELGDDGGSPYVAHDGVWEGYVSYILRYPEDKWSVFILSNRSDTDTESLAWDIAGLYE